jgi:hypothetical protein
MRLAHSALPIVVIHHERCRWLVQLGMMLYDIEPLTRRLEPRPHAAIALPRFEYCLPRRPNFRPTESGPFPQPLRWFARPLAHRTSERSEQREAGSTVPMRQTAGAACLQSLTRSARFASMIASCPAARTMWRAAGAPPAPHRRAGSTRNTAACLRPSTRRGGWRRPRTARRTLPASVGWRAASKP